MNNELKSILSRVDHTLLAQSATWNEIKAICDDGVKYGCASVCIPASYVKQAAEYVAGKIAVCTVIGFPNGYDTTASKCFQATDAVNNGATEIDMVINIGWVKDGLYDRVLDEIRAVKAHCQGRLLKVIIETCPHWVLNRITAPRSWRAPMPPCPMWWARAQRTRRRL